MRLRRERYVLIEVQGSRVDVDLIVAIRSRLKPRRRLRLGFLRDLLEVLDLLFVIFDQILLHFLRFQFVEFGVFVEFDVFDVVVELPKSIFVTLSATPLNID